MLKKIKLPFGTNDKKKTLALPSAEQPVYEPVRQLYKLFAENADSITWVIKSQTYQNEILGTYEFYQLTFNENGSCNILKSSYSIDENGDIIPQGEPESIATNQSLRKILGMMRDYESAQHNMGLSPVECALTKESGLHFSDFASGENIAIEQTASAPSIIVNGEILSDGLYAENAIAQDHDNLFQPQRALEDMFTDYTKKLFSDVDTALEKIAENSYFQNNPKKLETLKEFQNVIIAPLQGDLAKALAGFNEAASKFSDPRSEKIYNEKIKAAAMHLLSIKQAVYKIISAVYDKKSEHYKAELHRAADAALGKDFYNILRGVMIWVDMNNARLLLMHAADHKRNKKFDEVHNVAVSLGLSSQYINISEQAITAIDDSIQDALKWAQKSNWPAWMVNAIRPYVFDLEMKPTMPAHAIAHLTKHVATLSAIADYTKLADMQKQARIERAVAHGKDVIEQWKAMNPPTRKIIALSPFFSHGRDNPKNPRETELFYIAIAQEPDGKYTTHCNLIQIQEFEGKDSYGIKHIAPIAYHSSAENLENAIMTAGTLFTKWQDITYRDPQQRSKIYAHDLESQYPVENAMAFLRQGSHRIFMMPVHDFTAQKKKSDKTSDSYACKAYMIEKIENAGGNALEARYAVKTLAILPYADIMGEPYAKYPTLKQVAGKTQMIWSGAHNNENTAVTDNSMRGEDLKNMIIDDALLASAILKSSKEGLLLPIESDVTGHAKHTLTLAGLADFLRITGFDVDEELKNRALQLKNDPRLESTPLVVRRGKEGDQRRFVTIIPSRSDPQ